MTRTEAKAAQTKLKASGHYTGIVDGLPGPLTYAAIFEFAAQRPLSLTVKTKLGKAAARYWPNYGIADRTNRIDDFVANTCHETARYQYFKELGGKAYFFKMYDIHGSRPHVAKDLGNILPGDGAKYPGRGIPQLTGRANYKKYGDRLGIDLINFPAMAEDIDISFEITCEFWADKGMNALSDAGNTRAVCIKWNGGTNGLAERTAIKRRVSTLWA